jgi:hypothetical protein
LGNYIHEFSGPTEEEKGEENQMLTVKVTKQIRHVAGPPAPTGEISTAEQDLGRFTTRIVQSEKVDVHILRPGELVEVAGDGFAFYIAPRDKKIEGFADEVEFWFEAFIENSTGATTKVVRF